MKRVRYSCAMSGLVSVGCMSDAVALPILFAPVWREGLSLDDAPIAQAKTDRIDSNPGPVDRWVSRQSPKVFTISDHASTNNWVGAR